MGRPVRRRPGRGAGQAVRRRCTSTGGSRPYDIAGSRAHARVLHRAGLLDRRRAAPDAGRARRGSRPTSPSGDVHRHRRRRGRAHRAGARPAGAARPGPRRQAAGRPVPQRPDRHALPDVPARPRPDHRRTGRRPPGGAGRPRRGAPGRRDARPHPPPARPAGAVRPPRAGPRPGAVPGRGAAAAVGRAHRRLAVRLRRAGRLLARPRPGGGRRRPGLRARFGRPTRSTARPPATSSPSSPSSPR